MTARLLLVRHGETDANAEGRTQGRRDVPLNDRGRRQAEAVAASLSAFAPSAIYSSPSIRALDTMRPSALSLGLEVTVDERLAELDQGELDGMTGQQMRASHPEFLVRWREQDPDDVRMPGGETMGEAQQRMAAAAREIALAHANKTVAVASHNLALRALLCHMLGIPLRSFRRIRHDLASLAIVDAREGAFSVVTMNERCHLPGGAQ